LTKIFRPHRRFRYFRWSYGHADLWFRLSAWDFSVLE